MATAMHLIDDASQDEAVVSSAVTNGARRNGRHDGFSAQFI